MWSAVLRVVLTRAHGCSVEQGATIAPASVLVIGLPRSGKRTMLQWMEKKASSEDESKGSGRETARNAIFEDTGFAVQYLRHRHSNMLLDFTSCNPFAPGPEVSSFCCKCRSTLMLPLRQAQAMIAAGLDAAREVSHLPNGVFKLVLDYLNREHLESTMYKESIEPQVRMILSCSRCDLLYRWTRRLC